MSNMIVTPSFPPSLREKKVKAKIANLPLSLIRNKRNSIKIRKNDPFSQEPK